jgi:hypothetical protein
MSTPNDTDIFLIERSGTQYKLSYEDMSTLNDDDLLLVERSGTQYKIEAQYVSTGPSGYLDAPVTVATPLNGAGLNAGQSYEPLSSAIVSESNGVITFTDDTELSKIVGPVKMVDENGNVKTPQTSAITQNATLSGEPIFAVTLYNGAGAVSTVTTGVDNTAGSLIWTKRRNGGGGSHSLVSSVTGLGSFVASNTTDALGSLNTMTVSTTGYTTSGDSYTSSSGATYVNYNFKVSPGFLDIVTYQGDGTLEQKFNHGLQAEPGFVLIKRTNQTRHWCVWHKDVPLDGILDSTDDFAYNFIKSVTSTYVETYYQNQAPTNQTGGNYVAYVFGSDDTNIKCGVETEAHNKQINVGFEPAFFLYKPTDLSGTDWILIDNKRSQPVYPNNTSPESSGNGFTFTSTGVTQNPSYIWGNGTKYMYVAIRDGAVSPDTFELNLNDSTDLQFLKEGDTVTTPEITTQTLAFKATLYTGNNTGQTVNTGVDNTSGKSLVWIKSRDNGVSHMIYDTVRGPRLTLSSNSTSAQLDYTTSLTAFTSSGFTIGGEGNVSGGSQSFIAWNFRAAPGFMDIVKFVGTQVAQSIPHDLGSAPGLMIIKDITRGDGWMVYHKDKGASSYSFLDTSWATAGNNTSFFGGITPTSTHFSVGNSSNTNHNGDEFIAYLFADDGTNIKCGSYNGLAYPSSVTVNCGFKPGWLMVKRTDQSANHWMIVDTVRGGATELAANLNNAEHTGSYTGIEFGYPLFQLTNTGFIADPNQVGPASSNGGTSANYIYIAIREGATAGDFAQSATLVADADVAAKTVEVDASLPVGVSLTGPVLDTVSNTVSSQSGSTLTVASTTGTWRPGLYAEGATVTRSGPSPTSIVFTSANSGTTAVTGFDATLARRVWTLESASSASGPWSVVGSYQDTAANASQDGATPWGNPTLAANTFYRVKVKYESLNSDPVESIYNTFRTGAA